MDDLVVRYVLMFWHGCGWNQLCGRQDKGTEILITLIDRQYCAGHGKSSLSDKYINSVNLTALKSRLSMAAHSHPVHLHVSFSERTCRIRTKLVEWYAANARTLPWRTPTATPYAVLVSEIMCQQTQVKTVVPYFERWMSAFPTFKDLANADVDQVMRLWSGLGYYSRARKLVEAAKWVEQKGIPKDVAGWKKIPGCGDYTAGAVSRLL